MGNMGKGCLDVMNMGKVFYDGKLSGKGFENIVLL
jgi:hypothetical protein